MVWRPAGGFAADRQHAFVTSSPQKVVVPNRPWISVALLISAIGFWPIGHFYCLARDTAYQAAPG
jgi:hypothetical protein